MAFGEGLLRKIGIHTTYDRSLVVAQVPDVVVTVFQDVDKRVHLARLPFFRGRRVDVTSRSRPAHHFEAYGIPSSHVETDDS